MASFFGEIVLPSSRAFWTDDDGNGGLESLQEPKNIEIKWLEDEPSQINKLLVVEGEMNIDFVKVCLLTGAKRVAMISSEEDTNPSCIYSLNEQLYLCLVNPKFDLADSGAFTKAIMPLLEKSKKLIAVTCYHVSHFKSTIELESPSFLRSLSSKRARENGENKVPSLSQPNFVTGVSAGVLTYAEMFDLDCVLYVLYADTFVMDSTTAEPLQKLFSEVTSKSLPSFHSTVAPLFNKGNLYM